MSIDSSRIKTDRIAVVKVSPKGGHVKTVYVQEQTPAGWLRGTEQPEVSIHGYWYAPQNVLMVSPVHTTHDYGGIANGTLVHYWSPHGRSIGIVTGRFGARYEVTNSDRGTLIVDWNSVHPVEAEE
jgi:hypothetical protein